MTTATASPTTPSMGLTEWGMLILLSVLWGGSFFFIGVAVTELPTFTVVVSRVVLAALILLAIMMVTGRKMPSMATAEGRRIWLAFFGMGLLNNAIPFSLIVWGQAHIASGVAAILNATTPLFGVVVAHLLTADERMSAGKVVGVILGLIGVAVMIGGTALQSLSSAVGLEVWAQMAILGGALTYAFAGVFGRRFKAMGVSPMATATGQVTASSMLMIPAMLVVDQPWTLPMPGFETIAALVGLAALSTSLAYILYFQLLARAGATNLLLVTFLIPISAIALGIGFLGEVLLPKHLIGMALIGLGLAAIDGRLMVRLRG
ncbi:MAG: DMT family transporter [Alphaproteobacteria bacterium]|nr:DMT family transporter [Alphaproteobacteria bacterium SS10]